ILFPEDRAVLDELARDRLRRGHVPAGIAAQIEDDPRLARLEIGLEGVVELRRRVVREAGHVDVPDLAAGEVLGHDLLRDDHVPDDLDVDRLRRATDDREGDLGPLLAADLVPRAVDRQDVERGAVDGDDDVARLDPGLLRGRALDRRHDYELAVGPEGRAVRGRALRVFRADLRPDPLELAREVLEALAVLVRRPVRRVGIAERVDHALDRAPDHRLAIDRPAGESLDDRVVGVPEGLEAVLGRDRRSGLLGAALADE